MTEWQQHSKQYDLKDRKSGHPHPMNAAALLRRVGRNTHKIPPLPTPFSLLVVEWDSLNMEAGICLSIEMMEEAVCRGLL
jgi:hypothetical protein